MKTIDALRTIVIRILFAATVHNRVIKLKFLQSPKQYSHKSTIFCCRRKRQMLGKENPYVHLINLRSMQ